MDPHALKVLEFDRLLAIVAGFAHSGPGGDWVRRRTPHKRLRIIVRHHDLYGDLRELVDEGGALPAAHFADPTAHFQRLRPRDASLPGDELLVCRDFLRAVGELRSFLNGENCRCRQRLAAFADRLPLPQPVLDRLNKALDDDGQLVDTASPRLAKLRRAVRSLENRNRKVVENLLRDEARTELYRERFVTLRNGRYVLPVRREARTRFKGVVHDLSDSGRTVFMEPEESVVIGNELSSTRLEERDECRRVLAELSAGVRNELPALQESLLAAALLDGLCAVVRWAVETGCTLPRFSGRTQLKNVRHPLLDHQFRQQRRLPELVPLSLAFPKGTRALIVTGSNSGGKTVALKTFGLLQVAAQAGLPIPAEMDGEMEIFDRVFADIGDEQSLADNLSTFTGHLMRMKEILAGMDGGRALVLLDELGTGTDPLEGGAIGCALLAEFAARNALTMATTHLAAIKNFAEEQKDMLNGAVRFNLETLAPEYVLEIGRPGASHALRIAQRLGLPETVLERARQRLDVDPLRMDNILENLAERQRQAEAEEKTMRASLEEARRDRAQLQSQLEDLRRERKTLLNDAYQQAERIVANTRRQMEKLVAQLHCAETVDAETDKRKRRELRETLAQTEKKLALAARRTRERPRRPLAAEELEKGMRVWLQSLQAEGRVKAFSRGGKKVSVDIKGMEFTVKLADVGRLDKNDAEPESTGRSRGGVTLPRIEGATSSEINLLGKRVDQACAELDRFVDRARLSNLIEVRIVHGFGSGRLMKGVHAHLDAGGFHGRYRLADADRKEAGGGGVTILSLA